MGSGAIVWDPRVELRCNFSRVKLHWGPHCRTPVWASSGSVVGCQCEAPLGAPVEGLHRRGSIGGATLEGLHWGIHYGVPVWGSSADSNEKSDCGAPVWPYDVEPQCDAPLWGSSAILHCSTTGAPPDDYQGADSLKVPET